MMSSISTQLFQYFFFILVFLRILKIFKFSQRGRSAYKVQFLEVNGGRVIEKMFRVRVHFFRFYIHAFVLIIIDFEKPCKNAFEGGGGHDTIRFLLGRLMRREGVGVHKEGSINRCDFDTYLQCLFLLSVTQLVYLE